MSGARKRKGRRPARPAPAAPPPARTPPAAGQQRPAPVVGQLDLDVPELVKGASSGFTVLLLGELLAPVAGAVDATLGGLWLSLVGATGYVVAGSRVGSARRPVLQGVCAALLALGLTLPLRLIAGLNAPLWALLLSAVFAVAVGAAAGGAAGRRRRGRTKD